MKTISKILGVGSAMLLALTMASTAQAAAVLCPTPIGAGTGYDRQLSLTTAPTDATCYQVGSGNESFADLIWKIEDVEGGADKQVPGPGVLVSPFLTFTGLGSSTGGTFTLVSTLSADSIIVFKFGGGPGNAVSEPDWVAYNLNGATSGTWSWTGTTALSHVAIYGSTREVPEPTTLGLMGLGLLGIGLRMRRRQTA